MHPQEDGYPKRLATFQRFSCGCRDLCKVRIEEGGDPCAKTRSASSQVRKVAGLQAALVPIRLRRGQYGFAIYLPIPRAGPRVVAFLFDAKERGAVWSQGTLHAIASWRE